MVPRHEIVGIDVSDDWDDDPRACSDRRTRACPVYEGNIDACVGILHMKKVARMLARGELDRRAAAGARPRARAVLRARRARRSTKQLLNFQRQPATRRVRRRRIRRHAGTGHARGHPRGDRRRIHHRAGDAAQGRPPRTRRQLRRQRGGERARAESQDGLGTADERPENAERPDRRVRSRRSREPGASLRIDDYTIEILQTGDNAREDGASASGARRPAATARDAAQERPASASASRSTPIDLQSFDRAPRHVRATARSRAESRAWPPRAGAPRRTAPGGPRPSSPSSPKHDETPVPAARPRSSRRPRARREDRPPSRAMRTPPTTLTKTSLSRSRDAAVPVQHREQQREPVRIEAHARRGAD